MAAYRQTSQMQYTQGAPVDRTHSYNRFCQPLGEPAIAGVQRWLGNSKLYPSVLGRAGGTDGQRRAKTGFNSILIPQTSSSCSPPVLVFTLICLETRDQRVTHPDRQPLPSGWREPPSPHHHFSFISTLHPLIPCFPWRLKLCVAFMFLRSIFRAPELLYFHSSVHPFNHICCETQNFWVSEDTFSDRAVHLWLSAHLLIHLTIMSPQNGNPFLKTRSIIRPMSFVPENCSFTLVFPLSASLTLRERAFSTWQY